jgi:predicted transcriptional regulator
MHIELDDELVREVDSLAGQRGRSAFVRGALEAAVDRERRRRSLEAAMGSIADSGHDWDDDPAAWVRAQRRTDPRRVG